MRILTVPNWSFGRDKDLLRRFEDTLTEANVTLHYLASDVDHNRTANGTAVLLWTCTAAANQRWSRV